LPSPEIHSIESSPVLYARGKLALPGGGKPERLRERKAAEHPKREPTKYS